MTDRSDVLTTALCEFAAKVDALWATDKRDPSYTCKAQTRLLTWMVENRERVDEIISAARQGTEARERDEERWKERGLGGREGVLLRLSHYKQLLLNRCSEDVTLEVVETVFAAARRGIEARYDYSKTLEEVGAEYAAKAYPPAPTQEAGELQRHPTTISHTVPSSCAAAQVDVSPTKEPLDVAGLVERLEGTICRDGFAVILFQEVQAAAIALTQLQLDAARNESLAHGYTEDIAQLQQEVARLERDRTDKATAWDAIVKRDATISSLRAALEGLTEINESLREKNKRFVAERDEAHDAVIQHCQEIERLRAALKPQGATR